jgi:hypothetical protein
LRRITVSVALHRRTPGTADPAIGQEGPKGGGAGKDQQPKADGALSSHGIQSADANGDERYRKDYPEAEVGRHQDYQESREGRRNDRLRSGGSGRLGTGWVIGVARLGVRAGLKDHLDRLSSSGVMYDREAGEQQQVEETNEAA